MGLTENENADLLVHQLLEDIEEPASPSSSLDALPGPLSSMQCRQARLHRS
jgi:hypothetical protein